MLYFAIVEISKETGIERILMKNSEMVILSKLVNNIKQENDKNTGFVVDDEVRLMLGRLKRKYTTEEIEEAIIKNWGPVFVDRELEKAWQKTIKEFKNNTMYLS